MFPELKISKFYLMTFFKNDNIMLYIKHRASAKFFTLHIRVLKTEDEDRSSIDQKRVKY